MLYLFSIGVGVGKLVTGFAFHGHEVGYAAFVAPAMLAASAMNGAIFDSTFRIFFKLRYGKVYEGVLATPMRTVDIVRGELRLVADALRGLLRGLPRGDGRDGAGVVVVGGAGLARDLADRTRVRRRG